jgi:erythronate-4-phosphate dehydrogenase
VLLVRSVTAVNALLLDSTPVSFVGTATSGFNHVDREYLRRKGVSFAHAPGSNANSVVEYVLGAIAAVGDKLEQLFSGGWVGIIGYGNIGKLLAERLSQLGINYRLYDPWLDESQLAHPSSLNEVLQCDVISIHAELTWEKPWSSYHLLGDAELSRLSDTSLLINASRGEVIDTVALEKILGGVLAPTVILDVWEGEPVVRESLLSQAKFASAHIAGYSLDGKLLATRMLKDALLKHLGEPVVAKLSGELDEVPAIKLSGSPEGAALLRALLQHNYRLSEDDRLLRKAVLNHSSTTAALNFDRLRKAYRIRREVWGAEVDVTLQAPADSYILAAMGCKLAGGRGL